jgi:methyl-accepting chemotaxis protein
MTQDERFDRIDANIERLNERLNDSVGEIKESVANLTRYVLDFREETARHLEVIDNRLDIVAANINNIEARYPAFNRAILDFGKLATHLTNDQARNKNVTAELSSRMDRLEDKVSKVVQPAA